MTAPSPQGAAGRPPAPPAGGLPLSHTPIVAMHAPGPFLNEQVVTPSDQRWLNARTYIVRDRKTRQEYRALRVQDQAGHFVGYWAIEVMPQAFDFGVRFEGDRQDNIEEYEARLRQHRMDASRKRYGRHHD